MGLQYKEAEIRDLSAMNLIIDWKVRIGIKEDNLKIVIISQANPYFTSVFTTSGGVLNFKVRLIWSTPRLK